MSTYFRYLAFLWCTGLVTGPGVDTLVSVGDVRL